MREVLTFCLAIGIAIFVGWNIPGSGSNAGSKNQNDEVQRKRKYAEAVEECRKLFESPYGTLQQLEETLKKMHRYEK